MEDDETFAPRQGGKSTWTHVKISGTKVSRRRFFVALEKNGRAFSAPILNQGTD